MNIETVFDSIQGDLQSVEGFLHDEGAFSRVPILSSVGEHILAAGGKRFRPTLTILSGRLCGTPESKRIPLAASVELIHNATLLHDDIVDEATLRRGRPAAHLVWGDDAGVLTANFHFSQAFSIILKAGGLAALRVVNRTLSAIVEGELLQFLNVGVKEMKEAQYREIILRKTARLISAACHIGALPGDNEALVEPLARFGLELGMAFQMADDLLDYTADEGLLGKRVGADFREGKFTLPLIAALSRCGEGDRRSLLGLLHGSPEGREEAFCWAKELIDKNEGFTSTYEAAKAHIDQAVEVASSAFPKGDEQQALISLAHFVIERAH
jgi:octaprenyl-diphosphate synthase